MLNLPEIKTWTIFFSLTTATVLLAPIIGITSTISIFLFSSAINIITFYFSREIMVALLGVSIREVSRSEIIEGVNLYEEVKTVLAASNITTGKPVFPGMSLDDGKIKVYLSNSYVPNAFATGRSKDHAMVCINVGLLQRLREEREELEHGGALVDTEALRGVLSHELGHVLHSDVLWNILATCIVNFLDMAHKYLESVAQENIGKKKNIADKDGKKDKTLVNVYKNNQGLLKIVLLIMISTFGSILSRQREYAADRVAVEAGYSEGLKKGLARITEGNSWHAFFATREKGIVRGLLGIMAEFFSSHPNINNRIYAINYAMSKIETEKTKQISAPAVISKCPVTKLRNIFNSVCDNVAAAITLEKNSYTLHFSSDKLASDAASKRFPVVLRSDKWRFVPETNNIRCI